MCARARARAPAYISHPCAAPPLAALQGRLLTFPTLLPPKTKGMNLLSGHETSPRLFAVVVATCVLGGLLSFSAFVRFLSRRKLLVW